jgi:DNA-directed RNA polymerase subunit RPC12/RpoP
MDVTFKCLHCHQELVADAGLAGTSIQCPSCSKALTVPQPDLHSVKILNPIATSAAAKEDKHFVVPTHEGPSEVLIKKPVVVAKPVVQVGEKLLRIKTIRRIDCVEVGHDRFDEVISEFLDKVGPENLVSINTLNYTHLDIGSQKLLTDFGVLIVYRG